MSERATHASAIETHVYRRSLCLVIGLSVVLAGCFTDRWEAFVYPDRNNLQKFENFGDFDSIESCRASAIDRLSKLNAASKGGYECGSNCEFRSGYGGLKVCDETLR